MTIFIEKLLPQIFASILVMMHCLGLAIMRYVIRVSPEFYLAFLRYWQVFYHYVHQSHNCKFNRPPYYAQTAKFLGDNSRPQSRLWRWEAERRATSGGRYSNGISLRDSDDLIRNSNTLQWSMVLSQPINLDSTMDLQKSHPQLQDNPHSLHKANSTETTIKVAMQASNQAMSSLQIRSIPRICSGEQLLCCRRRHENGILSTISIPKRHLIFPTGSNILKLVYPTFNRASLWWKHV